MKAIDYIKLPYKIIRKFSISRLINLFYYLRIEGLQGTKRRFRECVFGTDIYREEFVIKDIKQINSIEECKRLEFKKYDSPQVSIIIPVYNEFSYTYHCLQSILKSKDVTTYEIIIADDCSNDLTCQISEIAENVIVCRSDENKHFVRNCNEASKYAKGEYIFFLNNDTQVQNGWLDSQMELMQRDKTIGMTGSKLIYPDGRLQEAGGIIWQDGSAWNYGNGKDPYAPEYNYVKEVDYISGAAIMIRKKLWEKIGGFDERFAPAYCEDSDLAFAVRKEGYKVVYQPFSQVIHFEGVSNGTDVTKGVKQYQVKNKTKLYEKWKNDINKSNPVGKNVFQERERLKGKKVILMIDHYVPTYDQDAGSRTVYEFLQLFVRQGFVVKFLPDNFHYNLPYVKVIQQMGIEVLYGDFYKAYIKDWLEENKKYIDIVFMNRPHISIKYMEYFKKNTNCKIIYYGHDLHFLRNRREYELTGDESKKTESNEWMEKELFLMRNADMSYYPSVIEVEEVHKIDISIRVKAVTAYAYKAFFENLPNDFSKREGLLFVGGFVHTPNHDAVLWFVNEIYPKIREKADIPFIIVGSNVPLEIKRLEKIEGIDVKGYVSDEELDALYEKCKLAVVPLRYGAGVKGKVVEAMYHGIPIVTTSVGTEGIDGVQDVVCVEDNETEFAEKILQLYTDNERLLQMQRESQIYVKEHFSMDAVWQTMKNDL